jgi:hypothetical protein
MRGFDGMTSLEQAIAQERVAEGTPAGKLKKAKRDPQRIKSIVDSVFAALTQASGQQAQMKLQTGPVPQPVPGSETVGPADTGEVGVGVLAAAAAALVILVYVSTQRKGDERAIRA